MKKLTTRELRRLILNEAKEVKTKKDSAFVRAMLGEEADPAKLDFDKFPLKLRDTATTVGGASGAKVVVTAGGDDGDADDDVISGSGDSVAVSELKPSQTSMDIDKATAFAIAAILKNKPFPTGPGGDLNAIISADNHIMDGHHRWIASGMVDPSASVSGERIQFPAKQLIAALNMITVALTDRKAGKASTGDFSQFNEEGIKKTLKKFAAEGVWSADGEPEKVIAALKEFTGEDDDDAAIDAAAKKMADNIGTLNTDVPSDFPVREDMPVISPEAGHVAHAVELLQQGKVDVNEPYGEEPEVAEEKEESDDKNESKGSSDDLIMERWRSLAGIL